MHEVITDAGIVRNRMRREPWLPKENVSSCSPKHSSAKAIGILQHTSILRS